MGILEHYLTKQRNSLIRKGYEVPELADSTPDGLYRFAKMLEGVYEVIAPNDFYEMIHSKFYEEFVKERDEAIQEGIKLREESQVKKPFQEFSYITESFEDKASYEEISWGQWASNIEPSESAPISEEVSWGQWSESLNEVNIDTPIWGGETEESEDTKENISSNENSWEQWSDNIEGDEVTEQDGVWLEDEGPSNWSDEEDSEEWADLEEVSEKSSEWIEDEEPSNWSDDEEEVDTSEWSEDSDSPSNWADDEEDEPTNWTDDEEEENEDTSNWSDEEEKISDDLESLVGEIDTESWLTPKSTNNEEVVVSEDKRVNEIKGMSESVRKSNETINMLGNLFARKKR